MPRSIVPESDGLPEPFRLEQRRVFDPPLTIGVISDTHIYPNGSRNLPREVLDLFRRFRCDLILHAGDANTIGVLRQLGEIAPVLAVTGNNDDAEVREIAPESLEFTVGTFRFALVHGHGGASARAEAQRRFEGRVDMVVYGHSHIPMSERAGQTVMFNPGSATDRRWQEHFGVGLIHVSAEKVVPEIVLYKQSRDLENVIPD